MSPRRPPRSNQYPVIVASKVRVVLIYRGLDVRLRLSIKAKPHAKGISLAPLNPDDEAAVGWIDEQAARWGTMRWTRKGWVREKGARKVPE